MWNNSTGRRIDARSRPGQRLTALELAAWRGLLRVQAQTLRSLDARMSTGHGLTNADYEVLLRLSEQPGGRLRMTALADAIIRPKSTLTRVVSGLAARGLVERVDDADDRRGASAVLTADGERAFRAAQVTHLAEVRRAFLDRLDTAALGHLAEAWHAVDPSVLASAPDEPGEVGWAPPTLALIELTPRARCAARLRGEVEAIVARIRSEPGCLSIEVWHAEGPPRLLLVERWRSAEALRAFQRDAEYLHAYLERTRSLLARPRRETVVRLATED